MPMRTTPSYDLEHQIDAVYPTEHITRELVEEAPRLGQAQAASFFHPQRCTDLFFQFARGVAEGGLGEVEGVGGAGQGAVFDDGANQCQV